MKNIILAIASFFATVLLLSQVALAQEDQDAGDPRHTISAQGEDPNMPITVTKNGTEAGVPNIGNDCDSGTCFPRTRGGRLADHTTASKGGVGSSGAGSTDSGSRANDGAQ